VTDVSNASRTSLLDLESLQWSPEMCRIFGVPAALLPQVVLLGRLAVTHGAGGIPAASSWLRQRAISKPRSSVNSGCGQGTPSAPLARARSFS